MTQLEVRAFKLRESGFSAAEVEQLTEDKDAYLLALRKAGFTWREAYKAWFGYL